MNRMRGRLLFCIASIFIAGCNREPYDGVLSEQVLVPFEVKYVVGDDGQKIHTLDITGSGKVFSATEGTTDNYSQPRMSDTFYLRSLNEGQITKARNFLLTAARLPEHCRVTVVTQETTLFVNGEEIYIDGSCDWRSNGYFELEEALFGKH